MKGADEVPYFARLSVSIVMFALLVVSPFAQGNDESKAMKALSRDIGQLTMPALEVNHLSTKYSSVEALVQALENPHSQDAVIQLLGELDKNQLQTQRLFAALFAAMERNPDIVRRIERNLNLVQEELAQQRISVPGLGQRILNSGLFLASMVGFLYSFQSAYGLNELRDTQLSDLVFQFSLLHFGIALVAEYKAAKIGLPAYFENLKTRWRAYSRVEDVRLALNTLKESAPLLSQKLKRWHARFKSQQRNRAPIVAQALADELAPHHDEVLKNLEGLQRRGWWNERSDFATAVAALSEDLSEQEKIRIREILKSKGQDYEFLMAKGELRLFESKVVALLKKHGVYDSSALKNDILVHLAAMEYREVQQVEKSSYMIKLASFNNLALSVAVTIMGLVASIGQQPMYIDTSFYGAMEWVRENAITLYRVAGVLTIPSIAGFYLALGRMLRVNRLPPKYSKLDLVRELRHAIETNPVVLADKPDKVLDVDEIVEKLLEVSDKTLNDFATKKESAPKTLRSQCLQYLFTP